MRRQLNTLYVTTEGAWLHKDGENIVMDVEGETKARIPVHMLESMVCFGRVLVSPPLLGFCAEKGICISFLSSYGKFLARVEGPVSGNVLLRREQYRRSEKIQEDLEIVRNVLKGKIFNQRAVLARAMRDHGAGFSTDGSDRLRYALLRLKRIGEQLFSIDEIDILRGMEGEAAQLYFSVFDLLIRVDNSAFRFTNRSRRPPLDPVNALLSFIYTLLTHDCRSALETVGLDPAVGFLHRDRPGRPSLALDLMEEFRPVFADRLVLSLLNRRQIIERDFRTMDNGAVILRDDARKKVLIAYQDRKREDIYHAFIDEKVPLGQFPFVQAQLLARHLRGDLDGYPPFLWK
ncbi:type I-C CRISPR-associated endonuclease Cas1c [Pseudoduganella danionis]|uniref:CRISPR-associated endonuclease Cas1 n=1 Tax=Pseudoduganella danionis TaxID=1890295 RepID=A0ABW9SMX2_9BURK|nr:type I-C CRISPR-associated endonuclease Cas1c [Pseudoduganella danionis]MTW32975.1 type I-C CRISPR-associated endonuclease Cas1 [Pseudoduganella danionis]